ncbi:hypothetical protein M758_11G136700 [Ceratodon purpureus]|nr:hypothetical protein M758_11G136700 [Ceratodon purpureus]
MAAVRDLSLTARWMLFLAVFTSWQYSTQASRFLQSIDTSKDGGSKIIRTELIHRDHPLSPIAPAEGTTFSERLQAAAKRSRDRSLLMSRGRRLSAFTTPFTSESAEYVISISFGTPPQLFTGMVDTGSDLVWIQCSPCINCYTTHPHPVFDPTTSSTEAYVPCTDTNLCIPTNFGVTPTCEANSNYCQIKYSYQDGSQTEGVLTNETMTLPNTAGAAPVASNFVIGCMNNNTGIFDNYDGIVGFARGPLSLPSQLSKRGDLNVFAFCLVPYTATTTLTSSLIFGSRNETNPLGLVYTPLLDGSDTSFYWVDMVGVSVAGVDTGIPSALFNTSGGVIFDSGTTFTQFVPAIYDSIKQSVANVIPYPIVPDSSSSLNRSCYDVAGVQNPTWPTMTYHFTGVSGAIVDFELDLENLFPQEPNTTVFCLSITSADSNIIGNIQQANHYIEHDVDLKRIGWISKDCTVAV